MLLPELIDEEARTATLSPAVIDLVEIVNAGDVPSAAQLFDALSDLKDAQDVPVDELHTELTTYLDAGAALMIAQEITGAESVSIDSLRDVLGSPDDLLPKAANEPEMPTAQTFPENAPAPEAITVDNPQVVAPAPIDSPEVVEVAVVAPDPISADEPVSAPVAVADAPVVSTETSPEPAPAESAEAVAVSLPVDASPVVSAEPAASEQPIDPVSNTDDVAAEQVAASPTGEQEPALNDEIGPEIAAPVAVEPTTDEPAVNQEGAPDEQIEPSPRITEDSIVQVEDAAPVQVSDEPAATAETQESGGQSPAEQFAAEPVAVDETKLDPVPEVQDLTVESFEKGVAELKASDMRSPEESFEPASFPVTDKGF